MNWLSLCLVLLIGGVSANSVLQPGRVFTYDYNTTIATGIPDVSGHYAVFTYESRLKVYPQSDGFIHFKMEGVKVGQKHGEIPDMDLQYMNIRTERNSDYEQELSRPFTAKYSEGKVVETRFEKDEEIWSVDFKKGIADLFQVQKGQDRYESMPSNFKNRQNEMDNVAKFYRSKEWSLIGKCEVQIVEESLPYPAKPQASVINITKFVNSENCNRTPEFLLANQPPKKCTECEADDATPVSHNVVTKINAEVRDRYYFIEEIYREGVVKVAPTGTEGDNFLSLYNQWLVLESTSSAGSQAPQPKNAEASSIVSDLEHAMEFAYSPTAQSPSRQTVSSIISELQRHLSQMESYAQNQHETENVKKILAIEALIHKGLRTLPREDLKRFVEENIKSSSGSAEGSFKSKMVLDFAARAGTKGAIEALLKLIQDNKITNEYTIKNILNNIATHVVLPTTEIADTMLDFCSKNKAIINNQQLQKTCYFSFAMLVSGACTGFSKYSSQPLPAERKCQRDKLKSYVTHVKHILERQKDQKDEEGEIAFTTTLGLLNVRDSIHALESRVLGYGTESDLVQVAAIYAYRPLSKTYPDQVRDILSSVLYNSKERSEARIAAAAVIFASNPPQEKVEELAIYTWQVEDQQLGAFIYSGLQALANVTVPCLADLANYASNALDIANSEIEDGVHMGYHGIVDNMIDYLEAGYALHTTFVGEAGSFVPSIFRVKFQTYLAGYFNNLFELTYTGIEMKDILDKFFGPAYIYKQDGRSILQNLDKDIANQGLNYINEKLGIKPRSSEESRAYIMLRLLHSKIYQYYFNSSEIAEYISRGWASGRMLDTSGRFNYHKTLVPIDIRYATPSAAGHHLHLDVKLPLWISAKGDYAFKLTTEKANEAKVNFKLNVEPTFAGKLNIKFGPVLPSGGSSSRGRSGRDSESRIPFSSTWGTHYAVGYDSHFIVRPQVSGRFEGQLSPRDQTVRLSFQPAETSGQHAKEQIYYETRPYTVIYPRDELKPIRQYAKPMRLMDTPYKFQKPDPSSRQYSAFLVKGTHEDEWLDRANIIEAIQERGVIGFMNYWFLTQRMRMREFTVEQTYQQQKYDLSLNWAYNPAESDPKFQPKNFRQTLWAALSGWGYIPQECSDASSSSSKPWDYQHAKLMHMTKSSYGSFGPYQSYRTTERPYRHSTGSGSSESSEDHWADKGRYIRPYSDEDSNEDSAESDRYGSQYGNRHGHRGQSDESGEDRRSGRHGHRGHSDESGENRRSGRPGHSGEGDSSEYGNQRLGGNAPHRLQTQTVPFGKGSSTWHVSGALAIKGQRETTYGFDVTAKTDRDTYTRKVDAKFYSRGSDSFEGKVTGLFRYPKPSCYFGKKFEDDSHKKITGDVQFSWGSNTVNFNVTVSKSRDQIKYDPKPATDSNKPWYYEECERDQNKGFLNSDACQRVMDHKNELHKIHVDVDYSQARLSPYARKASWKAYKYFMHVWYNHMTEDIENVARPGHVSLTVNFNYTMPVLDIALKSERETTYFENLYYGMDFPFLSPPSARHSFARRIAQYITNEQFPASCLASGSYLNTYDNNTWDLRSAGSCPYLVTKDCTTGNSFYVLLQHNDKDKTLLVGVLKHTIKITPKQAGSNGEFVVDGEGKQIQNKQIYYLRDPEQQDTLVAFVTKTGPIYNVILPYLGVRAKFDGYNLKVEVSHFWSNKLCGMCGEFRGTEQYDLIGPQQCAHANEKDLLSHYTIREGSCRAPSRSSNKLCGMNSASYGASPRQGEEYCRLYRHHTIYDGDKICFTTQHHPVCTPECKPVQKESKAVDAYCVDKNSSEAERLKEEAKKVNSPTILSKQPNKMVTIEFPRSCTV